MAINTPETAEEVAKRARVDVRRSLLNSDPFLKNSWLRALVTAFSHRVYDFYFALKQTLLEAFPDTAILNLEQWAAIWGITRTAATIATGNLAFGGTATNIIPISTTLSTDDGLDYITTAAGTLTLQSLTVTLARVGSTVTATTSSAHLLGSNILVTITGAVETEYNIAGATITVTSTTTFTYEITTTPSTPATGSPLAGFTSVSIPVDSVAFGALQNQLADTALTLDSPIAGVDDIANVDQDTLSGGTDQELDVALQARLLNRIQNPIAHFNSAEIEATCLAVPGVTRVFVEEKTPVIGQVTIYFMRDLDVTGIPDAGEVATVLAAVGTIRPANIDVADTIVAAPSPQSEDFTFSALSPNTTTMQTAITASLNQFFDERTVVGANVETEAYLSAIYNTVDPANGDTVVSFTLTTPTADLTIASGEIATLGNVTYPV